MSGPELPDGSAGVPPEPQPAENPNAQYPAWPVPSPAWLNVAEPPGPVAPAPPAFVPQVAPVMADGSPGVAPQQFTRRALQLMSPVAPPPDPAAVLLMADPAVLPWLGDGQWQRIQAGAPGQVLTWGTGGLPGWQAAPGLQPSGDTSGATDTARLTALLAGGGGYYLLAPGTFWISGSVPLALAAAGTWLQGSGTGVTVLTVVGGFTGSSVFQVTADSCTISDLSIVGANTGNAALGGTQAWNAIELSNGQHCRFRDLFFQFVNGWCIETLPSGATASRDTMITRPLGRNCAGGIHAMSTPAASNGGEFFLTDIQFQQVGTLTGPSAGLDALRIEDIFDVLVQGINVGTASTTLGGAIHVLGTSATIKLTNIDVGTNNIAAAAAPVVIETGPNGTPTDVSIANGSTDGGSNGILVSAGTHITLTGVRSHRAYLNGISSTGGEVLVVGCTYDTNNQSATTGADMDCSGNTTGNFRAVGCRCESSVASGVSGSVPSPVSTSTHGYFYDCFFVGSGTAPTNAFNGTPQIVRGCVGYNPRGQIAAPVIGASPFTSTTSQNDVEIIFTAINTLTAFRIGGASTGVLPVAGTPYHVPARQSLELDYSGAAPTWQWYAD
jgi:hypothetical protein